MRNALILALFSAACSGAGSVLLEKNGQTEEESVDTDEQDTSSPEPADSPTDTAPPEETVLQAAQFWIGTRSIHFLDVCSIDLSEVGSQLPSDQEQPEGLRAAVEELCDDCLIFRIEISSENTICEGIGDIPATGTRYRVIDRTDLRLWAMSLREDSQSPGEQYWRSMELAPLELITGDPAVDTSETSWSYSYSGSFQGQIYEVSGALELTPQSE